LERRREEERKENTLLKKTNSIEDLVGNEENRYPGPDSNKTMINVTKEPSDTYKNIPKEEVIEEITEKLMEKIIDMVNQKVQHALKKFKDPKNKEVEKTQKQINELREDFKKHQSETKKTTQNIKEELNKDMENLTKKNQTEILEKKSFQLNKKHSQSPL
jgi:DNA primase large subunit